MLTPSKLGELDAVVSELTSPFQATAQVVAELQRALLPPAVPVLPKLRMAAQYLAAAQSEQAGGDWFDAVALPDGSVALVVGDVVGSGVPAAAAMGQFCAVLRHLLATEDDLRTVLERADAFAARTPPLRAATMALARLDPGDGSLRYVTCGHPPPLIVGAAPSAGSGPAAGFRPAAGFLPATGSGPLGTGSAMIIGTAALQPGDLVLLYTDGLIKRPDTPVAVALAELRETVTDLAAAQGPAATAAETPADRVCRDTVRAIGRSGFADDVTTLAAQLLADPVPELSLEVPAEVASVLRVRRAFARWLRQIDATAIDENGLLLAVAETITNAVEHAYLAGQRGLVRFRAAFRDDGIVECQVTDHGNWRAPGPAAGHRGHGLMVAGQVVDYMRVSHSVPPSGAELGSRGTVVTLRHRLRRPVTISAATRGQSGAPASAADFSLDIDIDIDIDGPVPCARVSGPVDGSTAERLVKQLLTTCRGGTLPITLDLTGITYLASSGVRAIYQVKERLVEHHQDLTILAAAGSSAQNLLDMVRLPYISR
jgi:anti-anti-sigma factor